MDMSKDEVFVRLDSMCEAGLLDKIEQKNGEVFFKNPPKEAKKNSSKSKPKKKKETKEVKEEPPEDIEDTTQDSVEVKHLFIAYHVYTAQIKSSCKQENDANAVLARADPLMIDWYVEKTGGPYTKSDWSPSSDSNEKRDHELTILSKADSGEVFHTRDYIRLLRYLIRHMVKKEEYNTTMAGIDKVTY